MNTERKNELQIFSNEEFGEIRTLEINGEPWFVGKDIAIALGYTNPQKAIRDHVDEEDKTVNESFTVNGTQGVLINESGIYTLVFGSKLDSAKKFKHWVTSEVLPTIRKHGAYMTNEVIEKTLTDPDYLIQIATQLKKERDARLLAEKQIIVLDKENDLLAQKELTWADRPLINALVRRYASSLDNDFAKAWTTFKKEILYKHSINLNSRITNYLNTTGKKTKPKTLDMINDDELSLALSTIVSLCREKDIDISDILENTEKH